MKAYIGVDVDSALVHAMRAALGKAADVTEGNSVLRGRATDVFGPRATKMRAKELMPQSCSLACGDAPNAKRKRMVPWVPRGRLHQLKKPSSVAISVRIYSDDH